jgi:hypothetical protein
VKARNTFEDTIMRSSWIAAAMLVVTTCAPAMAAGMTRDEYRAGKARIEAEYESERKKCGPRLGNATDVCVALARGARKAATAELEAAYKPGPRKYHAAATARADADYEAAKQRCDYQPRDVRSDCVKDARRAREAAKAEADAKLKAERRARAG